ncbi:MAG TPA: radical SAM protein [Candidatus Saccharimonadales bacterium]|nr:radical SAM protein [Candidatus Saccharimonadales bacterium]
MSVVRAEGIGAERSLPGIRTVRLDIAEILAHTDPFAPVAPRIFDIEAIGFCPYRCGFCYGPEHAIKGELNAESLADISVLFTSLGTERFVVTGGEPLLRRDIGTIIDNIPQAHSDSCEAPVGVTLSTTGYGLLTKHTGVLESLNKRRVSEVGLPVHGHNSELHNMMMPTINTANDNNQSLFQSIEVLLANQMQYPNILSKLRTVATSLNQNHLHLIPDMLARHGVDLARIAWKVYQVNDFIGPRLDAITTDHWQLGNRRFALVADYLHRHFDSWFQSVDCQPATDSAERYMFLSPRGVLRVIKADNYGNPEEVEVGNLVTDPLQTMEKLTHFDYLPMRNIADSALRQLLVYEQCR